MGNRALYIAFLIIIIAISSCNNLISIRGSAKGLYGYMNATIKEMPDLIRKTTEPICDLNYKKSTVYRITGKQLQECLNKNDTTIVYVWNPLCKGRKCIPPEIAENIADMHNYDMIVIAEYYDSKKMNEHYELKRPIFAVDCEYYETNYKNLYLRRFMEDSNKNGCLSYKEGDGSLLLFANNCLLRQFHINGDF